MFMESNHINGTIMSVTSFTPTTIYHCIIGVSGHVMTPAPAVLVVVKHVSRVVHRAGHQTTAWSVSTRPPTIAAG